MKSSSLLLSAIAFSGLLAAVSPVFAQGTVFTYQGRLSDSGQPANGTNYGMVFYLYDAPTNGNLLGNLGIVSVTLSNGLFTVPLDFGNEFDGTPRWLQISVQKNGGAFTQLVPRQQLTPTPYAIFANTASNLSGTLPTAQLSGTMGNDQLTHSNVTVNAGPGLSGGGIVALGGSTTLANAGVLSVTGNSDITASTVSGAVTLGSTATSANTPNAIVKRDPNGNFAAASLTLSGTNSASDFRLASGTQSAVSALDSVRIVRGIVLMTGVRSNGTGFTANRTGTGTYLLTFNPDFTDVPAVVVSVDVNAVTATVTINTSDHTVTVKTWYGSGNYDSDFSFVAIGGR